MRESVRHKEPRVGGANPPAATASSSKCVVIGTAFKNNQKMVVFGFLDKQKICAIDFVLDIQNQPYVLEMNTIPGLQKNSNFLLCAEAAGITPGTVLLSLLYRALQGI